MCKNYNKKKSLCLQIELCYINYPITRLFHFHERLINFNIENIFVRSSIIKSSLNYFIYLLLIDAFTKKNILIFVQGPKICTNYFG